MKHFSSLLTFKTLPMILNVFLQELLHKLFRIPLTEKNTFEFDNHLRHHKSILQAYFEPSACIAASISESGISGISGLDFNILIKKHAVVGF